MAKITINDTEVRRELNKLANPRNLWQPMNDAVDLLYEVTQDQPEKKRGAFSRLATPAQKRAYWAKVSSGEAKHSPTQGYIRSGRLKRGWQKRVFLRVKAIVGQVVSIAPKYNVYVQGAKIQPFHKATGFETDKEIAKRNEGAVLAIFDEALNKLVK